MYRYNCLLLGGDNIMPSMAHVLLVLFGFKNIIIIGLILNWCALDQSKLLCGTFPKICSEKRIRFGKDTEWPTIKTKLVILVDFILGNLFLIKCQGLWLYTEDTEHKSV